MIFDFKTFRNLACSYWERHRPVFYFNGLFAVILLASWGCAGPDVGRNIGIAENIDPICFESSEVKICLTGILKLGDKETLVKDPGWCEYLFEIENRGEKPLTVKNVKLLIQSGRYLDSAATYEEIVKPPDIATEVAGDVAKDAAGLAVGHIIPFGGFIVKAFGNAASASKATARGNAKQMFTLRVLKNVELAPDGKVDGSAFFPNMFEAKSLNLDIAVGEGSKRFEIPMVEKKTSAVDEATLY